MVLIAEEILHGKLVYRTRKEFTKDEVRVSRAVDKKKSSGWCKKLQFKLWDGEPYDTEEKLQKFIHPHKVIIIFNDL